MIVKALMENTACSGEFSAEHGLSLYLEACGHKFLFDTGQSGAFSENAGKLGVDLADIDFTVLSHGHYDHGGGLRTFLTANDHAPVYLSRHAFEKHGNAEGKEIGLDQSLAADPRLVYTDTSYKIADGLELFSCNDRELCFPIDSAGLTMQVDERTLPEDFRHEQYLLIHENGKRILISGCSHKGVLNLLDWFEPGVLIGGFHFMKLDPDGHGQQVLDDAARRLTLHKTMCYTCHCTGAAQYEYLRKIMKDQLRYLSCGQTLEL